MPDLNRLYRQTHEPLQRRDRHDLQTLDTVRQVVDDTGRLDRRAVAPFLPPQALAWGPGDTRRIRTARAGRLVLLAAFATTAPTTGNAVVTLTQTTESGGTLTVATLTIPQGGQFGDTSPAVQVPAGAWLFASVTTANGAAGVSVSATIEVTT